MDWNSVDERLIGRGKLLPSLEFLERYDEESRVMNRRKVGRSFTLTYSHIVFLAVVHYLFRFPYR